MIIYRKTKNAELKDHAFRIMIYIDKVSSIEIISIYTHTNNV